MAARGAFVDFNLGYLVPAAVVVLALAYLMAEGLLRQGATLLGVSGGLDSVVMTHLFHRAFPPSSSLSTS